LCAVLHNRDSPDPEVRTAVGELRERLRDCLPYAIAQGVRVLAGTDVVGTISDEMTMIRSRIPASSPVPRPSWSAAYACGKPPARVRNRSRRAQIWVNR
jgi:hypothetical protein